ncbi:hypothetical protein [Nostoc sp. ChiVER01]|uniref:hypothetical protein n=1 Tax=Nostoc sp. ChiVER01 TaxID=3075382 RepID=UPI002AD599D1|nr:hypothetical protein [Nostoc sp. ChiVER01]MDZ8227539.1 hypothetical protein [Nostoc sp. ChiVER01]
MNREEIRAAIVVLPEQILFASPELNHVSEIIAFQTNQLVDFVQTIDPQLTRVEATFLAAALIRGLPAHFNDNLELLAGVKEFAEEIKNAR